MSFSSGEELARVLWYYGLIGKGEGGKIKIVCPFHDDVNPSMIVDLYDGSWFCFGCNESGDARRFVRLIEHQRDGCNDLEAFRRYLAILSSNKACEYKYSSRRRKQGRSSRQLYNEAYDYYHGLPKTQWNDSDESDVVEAREYMLHRGFAPSTLQQCGAKVNYDRNYGLIFPMMDNGKFKGWVCRTMVPAIEKKRKYLYNKGFSRATTVVGNYGDVLSSVDEFPYVVVVEGYMDRLKLVQLGVSNAVAILGWKMTEQQIQKLHDAGITKVISALDNDECGRKGTRFLERHFDVTRWRYLKGIKDPGDFTQETFARMYKRTMKEFLGGQ